MLTDIFDHIQEQPARMKALLTVSRGTDLPCTYYGMFMSALHRVVQLYQVSDIDKNNKHTHN